MSVKSLAFFLLLAAAPFANAVSLAYVDDSTQSLWGIDTDALVPRKIGWLGSSNRTSLGALAYDATSGKLFLSGGFNQSILYNVNMGSGLVTNVGSTPPFIIAMAVNGDGRLVAANVNDTNYPRKLYEFNKTTAATTTIGPLGTDLYGLTYNSTIGQLVGLKDGSETSFYSVDASSGATTLLSTSTQHFDASNLAYDAAKNEYWSIDTSGNLYRFDGSTFDRTLVKSGLGRIGAMTIAPVSTVPEPATLVALGLGAASFVRRRRR